MASETIQTADCDDDLHVRPHDDLREHTLSRDCWCCPTKDEFGLFQHHSLRRLADRMTAQLLNGRPD